jgi:NAD(P)-dependent dehydrogenase (short-subunit alcohol dehydrogenase family)
MLTWALARRLQGGSVTINAMAPGLVLETNLYRHLNPEVKRGLEQYGSRGVAEATETAVWLAASAELTGVNGRFFEQGAEIPCQFRNEDAEERLWQACERMAGHRRTPSGSSPTPHAS